MEKITVHSQVEYDAIPKNFKGLIVIENCAERVCVRENSSVEARGNSSVAAWGNSSVVARENSSVVARENSSVVARENSSVEAWENSSVVAMENSSVAARENSSVEARGNSSVEARGNSSVAARGNSSVVARENSSVEAWENSSVVARENSSVVARENSSVEAWENSSVVARGNSSVVARENSSVVAWGNSSVVARENSSGKAFDNSRILCYEKIVKFTKYMNAVIQKYEAPVYTKKIFTEIASQEEGKIILYKSVNSDTLCDFRTGMIKYEIGTVVECPDFDPDENRECGGGLHLSYTARKTQDFNKGTILKCLVDPDDIIIYKGNIEKVRCRKVVPVAIVNIRGEIIK